MSIAAGLSSSVVASEGASAGVSAATGASATIVESVGASTGTSTVTGVGETVDGTPPVPSIPPLEGVVGGGRRVLHRNTVSQWSSIRARDHRQRQVEDDRAILECLEHFLTVMEE